MKNIVLILFIFTSNVMLSQEFPKVEIVYYYINSHELEAKHAHEFLNNFEELFTIKRLGENFFIQLSKAKTIGIYTVKPNVTHTSTLLIGYDGKQFEILSDKDKYKTMENVVNFINRIKTIDKQKALEYILHSLKVLEGNEYIRNLNRLDLPIPE